MKKSALLFILLLFCLVPVLSAQDQQEEFPVLPTVPPEEEPFSAPAPAPAAIMEEEALQQQDVLPGKISLDIKGMDIIDVLKLLSMRANLNIVAGQNVRGRVTVFLKNVEPLDVLEIVLAANDLAYEKKGDILYIMTQRDYEQIYGERSFDKKAVKIIQLKYAKAQEAGKFLNQVKTKIGKVIVDESSNTVVLVDVPQSLQAMEEAIKSMDMPTVTKTFVLSYAKAKDLQEKLKESVSKNIGELKIDERMNKVVVTDLPERMEYISRVIADFDERDKVVLIEAKIIQITLNKDVGYGINWNNIFAGIDTIAASDLSINLTGLTPATTFTYTRARGATQYGDQVILRLLEKLGKTNVLSNPRITVANNQEAKVLVGTKQAYVTSTVTQSSGTTTTADNVQFVDVGVSLAVTPTITEDGFISMKIKPEVSSAPTSLELKNSDGTVRTSVPIVTTSEAETQLLIKDGTTVIMAGLMKDTRKDNSDRLPILANIPLLGHFFRSSGKEVDKTELVIFLTPSIVGGQKDASDTMGDYLREHEWVGVKPESRLQTRSELPKVSSLTVEPASAPRNFQEYCSYVSDKVNATLQKTALKDVTAQQIQLSFVVAADGTLKEGPRFLSQADERIKALVSKSVEQASPFFPFPGDYHEPQGTFKLTISFEQNP